MGGPSNNPQDACQDQLDRIATYREMQRSVPGLDGMYRLVSALIASRAQTGSRVLIAGAGGGREIGVLGTRACTLDITAVDPCDQNLCHAECVAHKFGVAERITFFKGTVDDLPSCAAFDIATSLLVMHHLRDDGEKLNFLRALQARLAAGSMLIYADICFNRVEEFESQISAYLGHAKRVGVAKRVTDLELEAIPNLPIISAVRTRTLLAESGFAEPREIFRSLWYRCWSCIRS